MKFFLSTQAIRSLSAAPSALGLVWKSADELSTVTATATDCQCDQITINNVLLSHFYKQFISTLDMTENRFHWFTGTIFSLTSQVRGAIFFTSWVYIDTPLHPVVESNSKCRDGQNLWLHYLREQDNCQVYITKQDVVTAHKKKQNYPVSNHWPKNLQL